MTPRGGNKSGLGEGKRGSGSNNDGTSRGSGGGRRREDGWSSVASTRGRDNRRGRGGRGNPRVIEYVDDDDPVNRTNERSGSSNRPFTSSLVRNMSCGRFIVSVLQRCPDYKLSQALEQSKKLWIDCWTQSDSLSTEELKILLEALARLPFSSSIEHPNLNDVTRSVSTLLHKAPHETRGGLNPQEIKVQIVELVARVFQRLVKFQWNVEKEDVRVALNDMLAEADDTLEARYRPHRKAREKLEVAFEELEKSWTIKTIQISRNARYLSEDVDSGSQWTRPTVGWLSNWNHFQPKKLPHMKVPGGNGNGVYESPDEYFDNTIKLWIGMTFVDGNNALLPHCTAKLGDKVCDQPLWPIPHRGDQQPYCRSPNCPHPAEFVCPNRYHDRGLCRRCAEVRRQALRGPPSKHASTHIYDGEVELIQHDGTIYLQNIKSRRPPEKRVHWRTTKRLSCPNLVGIVLLSSKGASLRLMDEIYWAKIGLHDHKNEYLKREEGKLVLNLLEYSLDGKENPLMSKDLTKGSAVAVIDCQTFVPEFIPVLQALEKQKLMPMPFQNGALVNLRKTQGFAFDPDESNHEYTHEYESFDGVSVVKDQNDPRYLVQSLIESSNLDPIIQIRRDDTLRYELYHELVDLVKESTLDSGQLESFVSALQHPVHCTQGPPGTGKSYLGVVIIRALLIIRELWMRCSVSIASPPILVLSYKNHAIDEFLLDLVRKEPSMQYGRSGRNYGNYWSRPLVRIGGGCNELELQPFLENNAAFSSPVVKDLLDKINDLLELVDQVRRFQEGFSVLEEARLIVFDNQNEVDPKARKRDRKICYDAALAVQRAVGVILAFMEASKAGDDEAGENNTIIFEDNQDLDSHKIIETAFSVIGIDGDCQTTLMYQDIPLLYDGIKHYDSTMDPAEIIYRWLTGFVPLPQCMYPEPCSNIREDKSQFCGQHRCKYEHDDLLQQCNNPVALNKWVCSEHLCASAQCRNSRFAQNQQYCIDHACYICVESQMVPALEAMLDPPRNTCAQHPLCWNNSSRGYCSNLAVLGTSYCESHLSVSCRGITTKGRPCKSIPISSSTPYCHVHLEQSNERKVEAPVTAGKSNASSTAKGNVSTVSRSSRCKGTNSKGKPCGSPPMNGLNYCNAHLGKSSNRASNSPAPISLYERLELRGDKIPDSKTRTVSSNAAISDSPTTPATATAQTIEHGKRSDVSMSTSDKVIEGSDAFSNVEVLSSASGSFIEFDVDCVNINDDDEAEESEHLQHLREVDEIVENTREESDLETNCEDPVTFDFMGTDDSVADAVLNVEEWNWEMSLETRWGCVNATIRQWNPICSATLRIIRDLIKNHKEILHHEKTKAKARVFEGKSVIGGTITGCVARLEAIRATNPFAILVEEASEVLEPLLFSCLCSTTCKLEMIGDHLQLQPSVMSKYDFQIVNKIHISMFERLICAPPGNEVPSSVLSIQRRMRKDICDLTRDFYAGITEIEDHPVCRTKTITSLSTSYMSMTDLFDQCEGNGREVPGISPHLYFWEHTGAEERSDVGLSRMNPKEATMVCQLTKYLVKECKVSPLSIAILTPYKGQLMLLRRMLMEEYGLTRQVRSGGYNNSRPSPACILSTVDRFQGDEADIVIVSLVIDGKSTTPFVKLQNRMIVLLSRARIGMYIIGNSKCLGQSPHWQATFELLEQQTPSDNDPKVDAKCMVYTGTHIGSKLPICCPQHRQSTAMAAGPEDLKLSFCSVVCEEILPCSHQCGLRCHWPKIDTHRSKCVVEVQSPCSRHPHVQHCSDFTRSTGYRHITMALEEYRCDVEVELQLPCTHLRKVFCADEIDILSGKMRWPRCTKKAVTPYVYPVCKHSKECMCTEYHNFIDHGAPPCTELEEYMPSCGHGVMLKCYSRKNFLANPSRFICNEKVITRLPRCGHNAYVPCSSTNILGNWYGPVPSTFGLVKEGDYYGPKDHPCTASVKFLRRCGHEEQMKCEQAFDIATSPPPCRVKKEIVNPECGHRYNTTCFEAHQHMEIVARAHDDTPASCVTEVQEGLQAQVFRNFGLSIRCTQVVNLIQKCGHKQQVKCHKARSLTTLCAEKVTVRRLTCGHSVTISCVNLSLMQQWKPWSAESSPTLLHESGILEDTLPPPVPAPAALAAELKGCQESILLKRSKTCGHEVRMKCNEAFKHLSTEGKSQIPICKIKVRKQLKSCHHEVEVECHRDISHWKCKEMVDKQCWNFNHCNETISSLCSSSSVVVQCDALTDWECSSGHRFQIAQCKLGSPIDCPQCSYEHLEREIEATQSIIEEDDDNNWPPQDIEEAILSFNSTDCSLIELDAALKLDFFSRKLMLLQRYKVWLDKTKDVWSRALFQPKVIPIIAYRSNPPRGKNNDFPPFRKFEIKDFAYQQKNGIPVFEATQSNFDTKVPKNVTKIVFGVMYTLGVTVDPVDIPKNKKNSGAFANWISTQHDMFGYDAMFATTRAKKNAISFTDDITGEFTVWDPYVLLATHEAELNSAKRKSLMSQLPLRSNWKRTSRYVIYSQYWMMGDQAHSSSKNVCPKVPLEHLEKIQQLFAATFSWASNVQLVYPWSGKQFCVGGQTLPTGVERQMRNKCSFIYRAPIGPVDQTACLSDTNPFAGIQQLKNIATQLPFIEADLFTAMELLVIIKTNAKEAEVLLNNYVKNVESQSGYCHPLLVLAFGRYASRQTRSMVRPAEFFEIFRELYPEAMELWMFPGERKALETPPSLSNKPTSPSATNPQDVIGQWEALKRENGCKSEAMDDLLKLVGLRRVKQSAIKLFKSALAFNKMTPNKRKKNIPAQNYCFMGNPGTGKTTVARLFARILNDSGIRRNKNAEMCTAQELKDGSAADFRDKIKNAMGGVLFIDEAYELDPAGDRNGKPIVAELLTAAEDKRDDLSIILAGYEEDIQAKLYKHNDGLKSRFEEVYFDDFDEADLRIIWDGLLTEKEWTADEKCGIVACRRLARGVGRKGFGNARAVRKLFEQSVMAATAHEDFDGTMELRTVDIMGERPTDNPKLTAILEELNNKTGWRTIKQKVNELIQICDTNYDRELKGIEPIPVLLNRLFLGNPGTGKTTCASIYGRILKQLNFLSIGEVVKKTAGDFIGQHVGESQTKTTDILNNAKGKVLVIDEAYNLDDNLYGKQALDVLVEKVQGTESDDIAVLLLGYEHQMTEMLRTQNPGLKRRFPPEYAFRFEDYTESELLDIFQAACARKNVYCPPDVSELVIRQLELQKSQSNFGNAGSVELILKNAMAKSTHRPLVDDQIILTAEDVENELLSQANNKDDDKTNRKEPVDPLSMLDRLYRVDNIREELHRIRTSVKVAQDEGSPIPEIGHFVFRGSPGTGKTTVARVMAKILHRMGILPTDKLVETSGLNLTGQYVGHTKKKVEDQLGQARGGVLFIDEAYDLGKGSFGEEAMTSLVAAMTNPAYSGMTIIIAGYPRDIDEMLDRNAGLKSRFTRFLDFRDWEAHDCLEFTMSKANIEELQLSQEVIDVLHQTFDSLRQMPGFGNGRDVMKLWKEMLECRASRVVNNPELERKITLADAQAAACKILSSRAPPGGKFLCNSVKVDGPMAIMDGSDPLPPMFNTSTNVHYRDPTDNSDEKHEEQKADMEEPKQNVRIHINRDAGVSDEDWAELERAKEEYEQMLRDAEDEAKKDAAKKKIEEYKAVQEKLRRLARCPMGFDWLQVCGGWRCAGGSHYVTNEQLEKQFMH